MGAAATENGFIHHFSGTAIGDPTITDKVPRYAASSAGVSLN